MSYGAKVMTSTNKIVKKSEIPEVDMRGRSEGTKRFWFTKGNPATGAGRPKGSKSLKEFAREYLMSLDDEGKKEFLDALPTDLIWRMAEGNPHSTENVTHTIAPTPIMKLSSIDKPVDSGALPVNAPPSTLGTP